MNLAYRMLGATCRRIKPRGRTRLADWLRRHPTSGVYRDPNGYSRRVDLSDPLEALSFVGVDYGLPEQVLDLVSEGDLVIDAGANVGTVTAQLCRRVGRTGRVLAIEPFPANVARLRTLGEDNHLPQLHPVEAAISDQRGTAELRFDQSTEQTSPYGSFTASWVKGGTMTVPTFTLDELVSDAEGRISLLKLDIEGAEPLALAGATRLLAEHRPAIYCEFNDIVLRDAGSSAEELLAQFATMGYFVDPGTSGNTQSVTGLVTDLLLFTEEGGLLD